MTDGVYLLLACVIALVFVVAVLASNPEGRNPHTDARRKWWQRNPK